MLKLLQNDWLKIATLLFGLGVVVQRANTAGAMASAHEPRIVELEKQQATTAALQQQTALILSDVVGRMRDHEISDAKEQAVVDEHSREIERLRDGGR